MERDHQTTLPVVLITWCLSVGSISRALAESQLIGQSQPIVAVAGDDVILPCSLVPPINAEHITVEWFRPDLDPEHVHVYRNGRILVRDQHPSYRYRTSLFEGELINGNVSLKLSRVKMEDEGNYTCFSPSYSLDEKAVIQLTVVSEPKISILGTNGAGVVLQCKAKSWYPEPQLDWREGLKDSERRLLSADVTQTDREPDGRYTVRSNVTVQRTDTNMFTCRVQLLKFNLKREAEIHVPGSLFQQAEPPSGLSVGAQIGIGIWVVGVVGVIGGAVFLYYRRQKKSTHQAGSNAFFHLHRQKKSSQPAGSNVTEMRPLRQRSPPRVTEMRPLRQRSPPRDVIKEKTPMEKEISLLGGSGGSREGEDSGWSSKTESNAKSDRDSLASENVELSTLRSDG